MAYIRLKKQIEYLVKAAGGKKLARVESNQWFEDGLKSRKIKDVEFTPKPFSPGKIYVFDYKTPLGKNDLEWFDTKPTVLALYPIDKTTDCGINLNLLPIKVKEQVLDAFYHAYHAKIENSTTGIKKSDALLQRPITFRYEEVKKFLDVFGFGFAIRRYKTNLKKNQAVVSYESWARIVLCDFIKIYGSTIFVVRKMFAEYNINRLKF
jgi:hypothetical protein